VPLDSQPPFPRSLPQSIPDGPTPLRSWAIWPDRSALLCALPQGAASESTHEGAAQKSLLKFLSAFAPLSSLCHPPPSLPQPAVPRPSPEATPVASASPILNGMSRPRGAVLRAAPAGCRGGLGARAAGCASGGHRRALGACDRGGGAKMPFILPIRPYTLLPLAPWGRLRCRLSLTVAMKHR